MGKIINVSIDVTKLDKNEDLFVGKKGTYANITVAENRNGVDDYGNTHYVYLSQSKEDRASGKDKKYLGNGKEFVFNGNGVNQTMATETVDNDLPF